MENLYREISNLGMNEYPDIVEDAHIHHTSSGTPAKLRLSIVEMPHTLCAVVNWWAIPEVAEKVKTMRDSERGGTSHACELETSLMLAIRPDLVQMEKAAKDISYPTSRYFPAWDFYYPSGPVRMMRHWSTLSKTGVMGDPTGASADKGRAWLEAAVEGLRGIIHEFYEMEITDRVNHH